MAAELEKDGGVDMVERSTLRDTEDQTDFHKTSEGKGFNDEAVKVLDNYTGDQSWTDEEEKRLMPLLCITYGLQYYDKAMLSQAALFGLRDDLDLGIGNRYSFTSSIFYLGFIIGAYPAMVLAQKFPIERVASAIVTLWGICLLLTIACTGYRGIYAQRFFLGLLESGVSPLFMLIVGSWYKKNEQAFRMGIWYSIVGYISIISPLINFGLGHAHGSLSPWRYMYIFAGCLTTLWGILLLFVLPPDPVRAKGFDQRERYILVARLRVNNSGVRNTSFKSSQVKELLADVRFWLLFWAGMLCMIGNGAVSTFIPIIIHGFGFNTLISLLLVTPLGAYSGTLMLVASYLAYKIPHSRKYIMFICQMGTLIGAALLWKLPLGDTGGLLFASIILTSLTATYGLIMGL
ncbi:hypothetical protein PRZ48_013395 [Zasmidium cellare]|uniref:Major facilitator superfamily (MFS) profile domain-containing protein n=1 Tax=Zasmidium cellare TaxID=395010 RepID=A0ABR0E1F7_ZASCE|nr:hypothetical protein PRZ48_013395 [Zasmidium cellare]